MKQVQGTSLKNKKSAHRLAGISSMVGTTIEWYDFFIYGAAAALIFNKLFFPNLDPLMGVMAAFATYAVGFIGRPLGGIVFGHFGDKVGRKSMLLLTLVLMGIPTVLIGLLPTYESIGYWATFFLVILRFIQGMAMGENGAVPYLWPLNTHQKVEKVSGEVYLKPVRGRFNAGFNRIGSGISYARTDSV